MVPRTAAGAWEVYGIIGTEWPIQPMPWIDGNAAIPGEAQLFMPQPHAQRAQ